VIRWRGEHSARDAVGRLVPEATIVRQADLAEQSEGVAFPHHGSDDPGHASLKRRNGRERTAKQTQTSGGLGLLGIASRCLGTRAGPAAQLDQHARSRREILGLVERAELRIELLHGAGAFARGREQFCECVQIGDGARIRLRLVDRLQAESDYTNRLGDAIR
jgi:hypothetical protein